MFRRCYWFQIAPTYWSYINSGKFEQFPLSWALHSMKTHVMSHIPYLCTLFICSRKCRPTNDKLIKQICIDQETTSCDQEECFTINQQITTKCWPLLGHYWMEYFWSQGAIENNILPLTEQPHQRWGVKDEGLNAPIDQRYKPITSENKNNPMPITSKSTSPKVRLAIHPKRGYFKVNGEYSKRNRGEGRRRQ